MQSSYLEVAKKDWAYSVQLNRLFLKPIGAWPLSLCIDTAEKLNCVILVLISSSLLIYVIVPCVLWIIFDKEEDLVTKIKMIGPLSFCVMAAMKYYILIARGVKLGRCIEHIRFDWEQINLNRRVTDRTIMIECARFGRSLAMFCACCMYSGGFFFAILMPVFAKNTEIIGNETVKLRAVPIYRSLNDPKTSPSYEIVQIIQGFGGFVVYTVTISACSLAAVFVMHACGQLQILIAKLDDLVDGFREEKSVTTTDQRFGDIVEHHLRTLGFIYEVEELLHEIFLIELIGCTLNICFIGYYLLMEWEHNESVGTLTYCILLVSLTFNIFILCYFGEILDEQCKKVGTMAYMIEWYRLPGKKALSLTLVIAVSNSSVKLTAGKFVELSLVSFCSVVKTAVAYFNLLRTMTM